MASAHGCLLLSLARPELPRPSLKGQAGSGLALKSSFESRLNHLTKCLKSQVKPYGSDARSAAEDEEKGVLTLLQEYVQTSPSYFERIRWLRVYMGCVVRHRMAEASVFLRACLLSSGATMSNSRKQGSLASGLALPSCSMAYRIMPSARGIAPRRMPSDSWRTFA